MGVERKGKKEALSRMVGEGIGISAGAEEVATWI